jgi:amino acid transporter
MYKDKIYIISIVITIISLFFFIISINDLLFGNVALIHLFSIKFIGAWQYWVLIVSVILFSYFAYMSYSLISDMSKFKKLLQSSSKKTFISNMPDLERISKRFGEHYDDLLTEAKHKWGIKK